MLPRRRGSVRRPNGRGCRSPATTIRRRERRGRTAAIPVGTRANSSTGEAHHRTLPYNVTLPSRCVVVCNTACQLKVRCGVAPLVSHSSQSLGGGRQRHTAVTLMYLAGPPRARGGRERRACPTKFVHFIFNTSWKRQYFCCLFVENCVQYTMPLVTGHMILKYSD